MNFIFDPSLVLYLPLNEPGGSSFMSRDAYGHPCTVTGALWRPDGRYFDGVDDKILIPDCAALSALSSLSISAWVKCTNATNNAGILSKDNGTSREWCFYIEVAGTIRSYLFSEMTTNRLCAKGTRNVLNAWHHLAVTWDGVNAAGHIKLFIDGETDAIAFEEKNGTGFTPWDSGSDVEVGRYAGYNNQCLGGSIGEVGLYARALTPLEVQHNYLATRGRYQ